MSIAYTHQLTALHQAQQQVIAGTHFIYQPFFLRLKAIPVFTGRYLLDVQRRTHPFNEVLKQMMRFVEIFTEFLSSLFRVLAQQGQGTLILPGGVQLDIDLFIF
ncbi:hypothetical protein D3C81_1778120 [compost metagenome]